MKNLSTILLIVIAVTVGIMSSCTESQEKIERDFLRKAIVQIDIGDYKWIVVLPGLGCHGCIQEAEIFMQRYITDTRILFVLTKVSSLKILQQRTEVRINEHSNIYLDRENMFDIPTDNRIYPCVIYMQDGKISAHSFQYPGNDAFHQLENIIASQQ